MTKLLVRWRRVVGQITSSETISSLVTQLLHAVQKGRRVDDTPLPEGELGPLSAVSLGLDTGVDPPGVGVD